MSDLNFSTIPSTEVDAAFASAGKGGRKVDPSTQKVIDAVLDGSPVRIEASTTKCASLRRTLGAHAKRAGKEIQTVYRNGHLSVRLKPVEKATRTSGKNTASN